MAKSIAGSDLFKAAVYGRDPNWGRIAAAAGYAGVAFDQRELAIALGPHRLMEAGQPLKFDAIAASAYMKAAGEVHGTVRQSPLLDSNRGLFCSPITDLSS